MSKKNGIIVEVVNTLTGKKLFMPFQKGTTIDNLVDRISEWSGLSKSDLAYEWNGKFDFENNKIIITL